MSIELPSQIASGDVREYVTDVVWPKFQDERRRLEHIACWARGENPDFLVPPSRSVEKKALLQLAKTPWIPLVVNTFAQCLFASGYRTTDSKDNVPGPWRTWRANGLQARQAAIHRSAIQYGYTYARGLLGNALDGSNQAVLRGVSPRRMFALYEDPVADDFPMYALELLQDSETVRFYTDDKWFQFRISSKDKPDAAEPAGSVQSFGHGIGRVPVVRYLNQMDLDGRTAGEVEGLIRVAGCLDKTKYDRLLAQHYNSVKIKTATGVDEMREGAGDDAAEILQLVIANEDVLMHGNPDVKFGTLDETDIGHFIEAYNSDLESFESAAQLPPGLTGKLANLSADALASARQGTSQKLFERQVSFGSSHAQLLRLAAHIEGDKEAAADFEAEVVWQDVEARSLSQVVDALGKATQMLGMPKQAAWERIPGVTPDEARRWWNELLENSPEAEFLRYYGSKMTADAENNDPNAPSKPVDDAA